MRPASLPEVGDRPARWGHRAARGLCLTLALSLVLLLPPVPASASVEVFGSGSTWSQVAVDQWRADTATPQWGNLTLNYQGVGSSAGRNQYYSGSNDFAVSEIPFLANYCDPITHSCTNEVQLASARPYAYMPIVAGGTSFMYNLSFGGHRVTDLQLSPRTLAGIFTGTISYWDDPAITADYGKPLPHEIITPVIRSDGSGTSAQFTAFMASQTPDLWQAFCARVGLTPCGSTSIYPSFKNAATEAKAQALSNGVAGYVAASYGAGAITYVETAYAKQDGFPVASVLNRAGYYDQPGPGNVAIALSAATLNADETQNLGGVYVNPDPRAYPVSSYSYMIVPVTTAQPFSAAKGAVLGAFINYFVCDGQQEAAPLGYSPLPTNLVQVALAAEQRIPGSPPPHSLSNCNNPYITGAFSPSRTAQPSPSARKGARQAAAAAAAGPAATGPGAGTATTAGAAGAAAAAAAAGNGSSGSNSGSSGPVGTELAAPVPTSLTGKRRSTLPYLGAGLALALLVLIPPIVGISRRRRTDAGPTS